MGRFLRMANIVKLNGVSLEVIKIQLFPFSLRDIAATWFESLPYGSVNTWEELVDILVDFFPHPSQQKEERISLCSNRRRMKAYILLRKGTKGC